jgi:hypothetical protein
MSRTVGVGALILVAALANGCGSHGAMSNERSRQAIAEAKRARGFARFSDIFPASAKTVTCSVAAGAPGNVFNGRCSAAASITSDGRVAVVFTQDFGTLGRHVWRILVPLPGSARVTSQSGGDLVQLIP